MQVTEAERWLPVILAEIGDLGGPIAGYSELCSLFSCYCNHLLAGFSEHLTEGALNADSHDPVCPEDPVIFIEYVDGNIWNVLEDCLKEIQRSIKGGVHMSYLFHQAFNRSYILCG